MSKLEKLVQRLLSFPKDFTWEELSKVLAYFGYLEIKTGKTGGARRKFADKKKNIINLHKPHPKNIMKEYQIRQVVDHLKERGYIYE